MKRLLAILIILVTACAEEKNYNQIEYEDIYFEGLENLSIRAIEVGKDGLIALSASNSTFAFSKDAGETWTIKQIDTLNLEYRSLSILDSAIILVNVGSPTRVLKSFDLGNTWNEVYIDTAKGAFYNSIKFSDNKNGIITGDPQQDCLSVLKTKDGGDTWTKIECDNLPEITTGEAQFAASNTCIESIGGNIWVATGGTNAHILKSNNYGTTWDNVEIDFIKGKEMTGIFSVDFYDENRGFIVGGDWNEMCSTDYNKFYTEDGGKTWVDIKDFNVGYMSCVQYQPNSDAKTIIALSMQGVAKSNDSGRTWDYISIKEGLYTFRFIDDNSIIAAGKGKIVRFKI